MAMKPKFPAKIFVYFADGGSGPEYLCASPTVDQLPADEDGSQIATYELTRVAKLKVDRSLT